VVKVVIENYFEVRNLFRRRCTYLAGGVFYALQFIANNFLNIGDILTSVGTLPHLDTALTVVRVTCVRETMLTFRPFTSFSRCVRKIRTRKNEFRKNPTHVLVVFSVIAWYAFNVQTRFITAPLFILAIFFVYLYTDVVFRDPNNIGVKWAFVGIHAVISFVLGSR